MKIKHTVGDVFSNREAQLDGTLNICTPWIDNDS